jgi:hypothetical protein
MKKKKHIDVVTDFETAKHKQLERLATKMLKNDDKFSKLKEKRVNKSFLDLF